MNLTTQKLSVHVGKKTTQKLAAQEGEGLPRGPSTPGTVKSAGQQTAHGRLGTGVPAARRVALVVSMATPWTAARQAPLCVGFSRQEHWSGLLPNPGTEHASLIRAGLGAGDSGKKNTNMERKRWPTSAASKAVIQAFRWSNSKLSPTRRGREGGTGGPPQAPRAEPPSHLPLPPPCSPYSCSLPQHQSPHLLISPGTPHLPQPHPLGHHPVTSTQDSGVSQDGSSPGSWRMQQAAFGVHS